jgi:nucleotide-binding universal stress UspA family protein
MAAIDAPPAHEPMTEGSRASTTDAFSRLLVPVDFSSVSRAALALALSIADRWGSEIILFHAAGFDENDEFLDHTGVPWGRNDVVAEAHKHLVDFADAVVAGSSTRVRAEAVRDEDPIRAVTGACERHKPSIVVIGTLVRRRRRWRRTGAEKLVRALDCPVLVVRGEPEAEMDADS